MLVFLKAHMPEKSLIAMVDETLLLTMLVTTSMSQLTAVCLQIRQWAQTGKVQSNLHSKGPWLADQPREAIFFVAVQFLLCP